MINGKRVLAYIPIRSGSKSIIDKNIVDVCGKPLVAYSIQAAKESKYVDEVIVSTDSSKYAEIVEKYGAKAPFLRPLELASDLAVEMDVCKHMMEWVENNWSEKYDIVLKLESTSPLRIAEDIDNALEKLEQENADTVITVTESVTHPFWMNILPENHSMKGFLKPDVARKNRQELPVYYQLDGLVYIARWDFLKNQNSWFAGKSFATITPNNRAIDIDGQNELELVRTIISNRNAQNTHSVIQENSQSIKSDENLNDFHQLFSLKKKVVIITGGTGMLGIQHAEILSDAGAHVVLIDIDQERCNEVAETITKRKGIESIGIQADITNELSVKSVLEQVKSKFGRVDILINNAAGKPQNMFANFEDYSIDDWNKVADVNLKGTFICSKIIGGEMTKQLKGVIVNIASIYGMVGVDQSIYGDSGINSPAVYSASKGGIINLTRYLATYWGKKGIRVNSLSPGGVENNQDLEFIKKYEFKTPLGRMANKDELKGAILFLCSDASSYMTGANLIVDGGWTAW